MKKIEIRYGSIIIQDGKNTKTLNEVVFREDATEYKGKKILKKLDSRCVGYVHKNKKYSEVKKSNEQRNKITGAYE
jgi:hypothetical protein